MPRRNKPKENNAYRGLSFDSEILLREAVRKLLSRIPEITLVQSTHGTQEVGRDIVYYLAGGLGERILCSCVVKNSQLSGSSEAAKNGALTILHQVEQSLLNPKKLETGAELMVQRVYIVTPYDFPEATLNVIHGHLKDRAGRVEVVAGARLFQQFRKYWPEFLADESTAMREHIRETAERLKDEQSLHQLSQLYRVAAPDRSITKYYVQPNFTQDLFSVSLDSATSNIVFLEFGSAMVSKAASGGTKIRVVPASPPRIVITPHGVERCEAGLTLMERMSNFVSLWDAPSAESFSSTLRIVAAYVALVKSIRDRHVRTEETDPLYVTRRLTESSKAAELGVEETALLLETGRAARTEVKRLLDAFCVDLSTTDRFLEEVTVDGLAALSDPRYRIAVRVRDMYENAPEGVFVRTKHDMPSRPLERRIQFPNDFLDGFSSSVYIVGAAGYGKTSFCRWNALRDAEAYACGMSSCIPAYFALNEIARGPLKSFEQTFLQHVGRSALVPADERGPIDARRQVIRLYLDGLDEVPRDGTRQALVGMVRKGLDGWTNIQVVMTARDYIVGPWLSWLPKFHLSTFTQPQLNELLTNWFDGDKRKVGEFNDQVDRTPLLRPILSIPLLATLVILVYRQTGNLPSSRKRLYETFVDLLNAGWDLAKGVQRGGSFGPMVKMAVLKKLAYSAHLKGTRQFPRSFVRSGFSSAFRGDHLGGNWEALLSEILQDRLLVVAGDSYSFAHLSFQEYLTAVTLAGDPHPNRRSYILRSYLLGDDWWLEVLSFYIELSANVRELREWITAAAQEIKEKETQGRAHILLQHIGRSFPGLSD